MKLYIVVALIEAISLLCAACGSVYYPSATTEIDLEGTDGIKEIVILYDSARREKLEISEFIDENIAGLESLEYDLISFVDSRDDKGDLRAVAFELENGIVKYRISGLREQLGGSISLSDASLHFLQNFLENGWIFDVQIILESINRFWVYRQLPTNVFVGICVSRLSDEVYERLWRDGLSDYDDFEWWSQTKHEAPQLISGNSGFYIWREVLHMN